MRQRLDIADVEERTKIRAKYLRALENEEWALLPGHTFVKTFLRTYAEVVGVDPHLLVEEYRMSHESEETDFQPLAGPPAAAHRETRRDRRRASSPGPRRRGGPSGPPRIGTALAVLGVALVAFLLVLGLSADDDGNGNGSSGERATDTTAVQRERTPAPKRRSVPAGATLRITPTVPTYACVDTGEGSEVVFEGTLEDARTFRNRERVRVNLGKRSVELRANGKDVQVVDSPEPLGFEVTKTGSREIVEGTRPCA